MSNQNNWKNSSNSGIQNPQMVYSNKTWCMSGVTKNTVSIFYVSFVQSQRTLDIYQQHLKMILWLILMYQGR